MITGLQRTNRIEWFSHGHSMAGGWMATFLVPIIAPAFPQVKTGYLVMVIIFGVLAMLPYFMLFLAIKEKNQWTPT